jgi:hypothetical protein
MNLRVNLFVCIIITFFSCKNNTNDYNSKNSMYIDKIEQNYKEFKEDDWKIVEEKYKEYIIYYEKTKETMTDEERSKVNQNIGKYKAILLKKEAVKWKENFKSLSDQAKGFIDEFAK